tara:strand:- start:326 stop:526 length:201 start_codon:yes stop_codon:yes gene_type:complete
MTMNVGRLDCIMLLLFSFFFRGLLSDKNDSKLSVMSVEDGYLTFAIPVTARASHAKVDNKGFYNIL